MEYKVYRVVIIFFICFAISVAEPIAMVNGKVITTDDLFYLISQSGTNAKPETLSVAEKIALRERLIEKALFLESAKKTTIEKSPQYLATLARLKDDLLVEMWLKEQMNFIIISDGEAKDFYTQNRDKFSEPTMVHARQILVKNDTQARYIIAALENLKGDMLLKTFVAIANYHSLDRANLNGGDMGLMSKEQMSPAFSSVAWNIPVKSIYKTPIKSNAGYHVVYIEDKLEHKQLPYEVVKKDIIATLKQKQFTRYMLQITKDMKSQAKIIIPR